MIRLVANYQFRIALISLLTFCLVYGPVYSLNPARAEVIAKRKKIAAPQPITKAHKPGEVIIKFKDDAPQQIREQIIQTYFKNEKKLRGRGKESRLTIKDGFDLASTIFDVKQFAPFVEFAEPNWLVTRTGDFGGARPRRAKRLQNTPNDPRFASQWALNNTGQDGGVPGSDINPVGGWGKTTGSRDTVIAVIDTGVDIKHPDLDDNIWVNKREGKGKKHEDDDRNGFVDDVKGWNFIDDNNNVADDHGHGTAMAGIIAAEGDNGQGGAGVMWRASVMPLKALDSSGGGAISDVVEAMDYAVENGASVINCSFGTEAFSQSLLDAVNRASRSGALVVASAGNNGWDLSQTPYYPASYTATNLITVAATTNGDMLATFSNYGGPAQVAAPGIDVLTTYPGRKYISLTGTSAAAPLVAGVAGLLKTIRGWVSTQWVRQVIIDSARKVPTLAGKVQSSGVVSAGESIVSFTKERGGSGNGGGGNGGYNVNNVVSSGGNSIDIDYMRSNAPNGAEPHVSANELPNYVYDDPQPTNTQWFDAYYHDIGNLNNSVGYAGVMPGEIGDPTTSGAVGGIQTVDLGSQNINFTAPVVSLSGRAGLNLNLSINYNSKSVWGESNNTWAAGGLSSPVPFNSDKGFPGPGWRAGFGVIQGIYLSEFSRLAPYLNGSASAFFTPCYLFIGPDGKRHNLFESFPNTNVYKSIDNTNMIFDGGSRILRLADGTQITFGQLVIRDGQLLPTQVKDRNGNIITIVNATISNGNGAASNGDIAIDYAIDTLGRTIDFYYESNRLRKIRQNRDGAWYDYAVIDYAPVTMSVNFVGVTLDPGTIGGNVVWLPSRVDYPTGENYRFYYTSYAQMYLVEKWVPAISAQGAERRVGYTRYNLPSYNGQSYPANPLVTADAGAQNRCPTFTQRKEWAENWNDGNEASYNYEFAADGSYSKLTDPAGRVYRTDFHSTENIFKVFSSESSYNNGNGVPLKTVTMTYLTYGAFLVTPIAISEIKIQDEVSTKRTAIDYNFDLTPSDVKEYLSDGQTVYRRTHIDYNTDTTYLNRNIIGLPKDRYVYDGSDKLIAKTSFSYDEGHLFMDASADGVIQHDNSYNGGFILGRANLTTVTQYAVDGDGAVGAPRALGMRKKYDSNGNVRVVYDPENRPTSAEMTDNFTNKPSGLGQTHGMPTVIIDADGFRNGAKYNYHTGLPVQSYHLSGSTPVNVTSFSYTTGDRIQSVTRPDGGNTSWTYWDNWLARAQYTLIDVGKQQYGFVAWDGAGNTRWQGADHPEAVSGKFSIQRFFYDNMGRVTDMSNVTASDGALTPLDGENWYYTSIVYDSLDRPSRIYRQDHTPTVTGGYVQYDYTGCGCSGGSTMTVTDELGKKRKVSYDFLGRLAEAHELFANGTTYSKVVYGYTLLDRLQKIEHYNGGSAMQERTFGYDNYGRLQSETSPEAGTVSYGYTPDDLIQTVTDARGISATFGYNNRRLITQVNYSDADTPDVFYDYGEYGERRWMEERNNSGATLGKTTYDYWPDIKLKSETRQFETPGNPLPPGASGVMQSGVYKLNYVWNLADRLNQVTVTVNGWVKNINFGWNSAGGVTGVGTNIIGAEPNATSNVVGGLQYRGFGGVRGMNFGANPRKMEVSWDLRRQQMTRIKVMRTDNTDPIVDQEYDYYTGPNGQNNGRIQRVTDYLDAAYSATYSYDDINRLSAITAGAYSRAYTFDEWGNLRALAATGGGETGSYTLNYASNASGAPATNRISGHGYDAAGNLTNDGSIYAYDAGSRLKSVNGTSVTYGYDGDGRRVKNQVSPCGPIYYYLWSSALGQVMAEINGGDGSVYRAYVYSPGGQMLAEQSYDGQFYWTHKDHLGSGRKLTNSSGTVVYRGEFDPHGQAILEVGEETYLNSRKFAGYERDWATNLDNANARIFSHNRGRFIQPDPLGFLSIDPAKPQSLNAYSYVYNDPANFVDPTGEIAIGIAIILAAGLVGGAVEAYNCNGCSGMQRLKAFGIGFAAGAVGGAAAVLGAATGSLLGVAVFGGIGGAASTLVGNGLKNGGLSKSDIVPAVTAGAVGFVLAGGAQAIMNKVLPASGYFSQTNLVARNLGSNYLTPRWQMYQVNVWNLMHARGWMSRPAETFNNVGANTLAALTQPIIQPKIDSVVSSALANIQVDLGMLPGVDGGYGASLGPWDSSRLFKPGGAFYFPTLIDCGLGCITVYPDRQIWNGGSLTPTGGNTRPRR
jgi:RHS repeat-associated protein